MNVDLEKLLAIIGELEVQRRLLMAEVERLTPPPEKEPE